MKAVLFLSLVIVTAMLVFVPASESPWSAQSASGRVIHMDGEPSETGFEKLITALRDSVYLIGEFGIQLLEKAWERTPFRFRVVFGVLFLILTLNTSLVVLGTTRGFHWRWFD